MSKRAMKLGIIIIALILVIVVAYSIIKMKINVKSNSKKSNSQYSFQLAELQADDYPTSLADKKFAELVYDRSEGRIQIDVVTGGKIGEEAEVVEKLQNGSLGFARVSIAPMAEYVDSLNALMLPYLYKDDEHMWRVLNSELGDQMLQSISAAGMVGLAWYDSGARSFYFKDKVQTLQALKNKKIRVQTSSLMFAMCEALNCYPMTSAENELTQNAQIGKLDGAENNIPTYASYKQYEVFKYFLQDEHTRIPEILAASQAMMEELSDEDIQIINECAKETEEYEREQWNLAEDNAKKMLVEKGVVFITLSEQEKENFVAACAPLYNEFGGQYKDIIDKIKNLGQND